VFITAVLAVLLTAVPAQSSPSDDYAGIHLGDLNLPAGCITDLNPANPDNHCFHMKVGLNALDSPQIDVAVLAPVSPGVERDLRAMNQVIEMWEGGFDYLAGELGMDWLRDGVDFRIHGYAVPVDEAGNPTEPINLIDPEVVVIMSNPAGGIGIGIDPAYFVTEVGITDGQGVPCTEIAQPFSLAAWEDRPGYDGHHGEGGGIYVEDCGGVGGNVCFAINGAVDPVPGATDFFPEFDLVAHEVGHCFTLGHVGDGADGPWGPTPTEDIMAYSTDPPGINKCVSTLDVEGFALRMSNYLDVNGDGSVTKADRLEPNDVVGDGLNSFQVQHPADHHYASSTGLAADCPQPDLGLVPGTPTDWMPTPVNTAKAKLGIKSLKVTPTGVVKVAGAARWIPLARQPKSFTGSVEDATSDSTLPTGDITGVKVKVTDATVNADITVSTLWPVDSSGALIAYSVIVSGRRFDSFVPATATDGKPIVIDNAMGFQMPDGTVTWDRAANTVRFKIPRHYLLDNRIEAPYSVTGTTGTHARTNDWLANDDYAPDKGGIGVAGPKLSRMVLDAPKATKVTTKKVTLQHEGGNSFMPNDSTLGVGGLVSAIDNYHYLDLPVAKQSTVEVTLNIESGTGYLDMIVSGGSTATKVREGDTVTVTVPWARRDLVVTVDPQEIYEPLEYTVTAKLTTVVADADRDGVPNVADVCPRAKGPWVGGGCPDADRDTVMDKDDKCPKVAGSTANGCPTKAGERVVMLVDGKVVDVAHVMTKHGRYDFSLSNAVGRGKHTVTLVWYSGGKVISRSTRSVG
jgi:hypothetical protein